MNIVDKLPHHACVQLMQDGERVCLWIGAFEQSCILRPGEYVRFSKRGIFKFITHQGNVAVVEVKVPRKGWNPSGPSQHQVIVQKLHAVSIFRTELYKKRTSELEVGATFAAVAELKKRRPWRVKIPRPF